MMVKKITYQYPLLPVSCSLLTVTANIGINKNKLINTSTKKNKDPNLPNMLRVNAITKLINDTSQYSSRLARPLKSENFSFIQDLKYAIPVFSLT